MTSLLLVGTGLIGGSFALAARQRGLFDRIVGIDRDADALARAVQLGIVDATAEGVPDTAGATYDAACIAVPQAGIARAVRETAAAAQLVFDVGSVKAPVLDALTPPPPHFVPCHPIAGSERHGPSAARADLFQGCSVVLTPAAATDAGAVAAARGLWERIGARTVIDTAANHDARFALLSHLPHLVAFAFMEVVAAGGGATGAGSGFRDFTRIAGSDADVWHDILHANASAVRGHLDALIERLRSLGDAAEAGGAPLRERIAAARQAKLAANGIAHRDRA